MLNCMRIAHDDPPWFHAYVVERRYTIAAHCKLWCYLYLGHDEVYRDSIVYEVYWDSYGITGMYV